MKNIRPPRVRAFAAVLASFLLLAHALVAYEVPLESGSVREGYFLGQRNGEQMFKFLDSYVKHFSLPKKGPYISEVELLTPYAQVVDISRQRTAGYSAQQAAQDYKDRGDLIRVRIRIELTASYGEIESPLPSKVSRPEQGITTRPADFWKDFQFRLTQKDETVESVGTYGEPIFFRDSEGSGGLAGAQVWLQYDAKDVASSEAVVEVIAPDGQKVAARFDLEKLR
jgi:hypothetical protein